jgi:putative ribosome biogenesis GTPase RsgA
MQRHSTRSHIAAVNTMRVVIAAAQPNAAIILLRRFLSFSTNMNAVNINVKHPHIVSKNTALNAAPR